ncbi:hypothetical protein [Alienimonas chondri]|uniref:Phage holin family protein n=1 Tax=Alienimonas chondri TaxID=2681879 RepID=A0ABX1VES6_9PLAN|nr:hypothetical protein [Alienimonas chondri]NNJ26604.1 hypothetical protein [Alienimonas chondri]
MPFDPVPTAFGLCLVVGGTVAAVGYRRGRAALEQGDADGSLEEWELNFHRAKLGRRRKVAGLLLFLGVAIPVGDAAILAVGAGARHWFLAYLGVLLAAVNGLILLAVLDWWATVSHTRDRIADVRAKRTALEYELRRLKEEIARPVEPVDPEPNPPGRLPRNRLRDYSFDD